MTKSGSPRHARTPLLRPPPVLPFLEPVFFFSISSHSPLACKVSIAASASLSALVSSLFRLRTAGVSFMTSDLQLPPGFRFHPTDEELVNHYLCRKCASLPIAVPIITELDLYKYDPWDLPGLASCGEKEWYFFSPRDRKYPNGSRPNRAAGSGYWKATGADKPIGHPKPVGIKKALVFYSGKAPRGEKTNWIMHEYRLAQVDRSARKKNSLRLDDWVLCRIYNKKGSLEKHQSVKAECMEMEETKPKLLPLAPPLSSGVSDYLYLEASDSVPKLHTDSSCSEHAVSPELACEVQSEPKWKEWEKSLQFPCNFLDATMEIHFQSGNEMSPLQDMFMYLQ